MAQGNLCKEDRPQEERVRDKDERKRQQIKNRHKRGQERGKSEKLYANCVAIYNIASLNCYCGSYMIENQNIQSIIRTLILALNSKETVAGTLKTMDT